MKHLALLLLAAPVLAQEGPASADSASLALETRMVETLGGRRGWERARVITFTWDPRAPGRPAAPRKHVWDVWTGRYRLELATQDGQTMVALFNGNTKEGRVWLDGTEVADDSARAAWLDHAQAIYINDTYWLVMPFKWRDPGVHLRYEGRQTVEGGEWEVVELTFENVGRTPDNRFLAYLNPSTGRMEMWDFFRRRNDPEPSSRFTWEDYRRFGPITLSVSKRNTRGEGGIFYRDVVVYTEVPDTLFRTP